MTKARGFTLIELLVAVTILAIILAVAAPSFSDAAVSSKVSDNANRIATSASFARGEAIKRNGRVILCMSADGATCAGSGGWEQGWIVFHDANTDGVKDAGEAVLMQEGAAPAGYKLTGVNPADSSAITSVNFTPTSVGSTQARWTVCRATPSVHAQQRQVDVNATGRPSVKKITGTTCT
jgi:type IV fimbrial biogenesis protein FimT